ncbi:MAG TPA: MmcQ/YjbR family DNA-binding protein [Rhizomicrobium sp.]|nr:MmcQ/YjbR family DNA-binding protein [Rhizomicrobium sp.]
MRYSDVDAHCRAMPGVTVHTPWGDSVVYKVGGKMFAMIPMDGKKPSGVWFKAGETSARILTQIKGIEPCPYLARAHWVAMDNLKPLKAKELREYLTRAHALVAQGLSKKKRASLGIAEHKEIFDPFA